MTATFQHVDVITAQAKEVRFARTMLTLFAMFFYAIGWTVGKVWLGFVWCLVAVKVGYLESVKAARAGKQST